VPSKAVSVPLKFPTRGNQYDDLSDEEKEQWMPWSGVMMEARRQQSRRKRVTVAVQ